MAMKFDSIEGSGYPTALAAFSAGVSLCSTSLGSTFIILASANLQKTPIGTLIAGAAMLDDILVLVMVKIITALGQGQSDSWTIARPAISSLGLILATFLLTPFLLKLSLRGSHSIFTYPKVGQETFGEDIDTEKGISRHTGFILSTLMLIVLVTIAACVEGSILLSAFLAGAVVRHTWQTVGGGEDIDLGVDRPTMMFEEYYKPIIDHILVPFFFASIGFSIPVSEMFSGSILWKGILYGCLMFLAKASVGVVVYFEFFATEWSHNWTDSKKITLPIVEELPQQDGSPEEVPTNNIVNQKLKKGPPHLDAIIVGSTMIARGGFGFLVASEAQSSGTLGLSKTPIRILNMQGLSHKITWRFRTLNVLEDQIFLVIIWALVLCTIVGPVVSGIAVRRKLVKEREGERCECGVAVGQRIFGTGDEG
ncbi:putative na+ h+ protein [Botrytis fragariae]|uniref:Putative na+ h+ protein n=1 Tax=Botrytis fragariae TaxID=1964551 RepID=A0A8H6AV28_9HELO|nr:putative na+ h+ protein [Botrytis fragariae]KAF5874015.1 putative na+ h+ protein [Botrytis fragariae]